MGDLMHEKITQLFFYFEEEEEQEEEAADVDVDVDVDGMLLDPGNSDSSHMYESA